MVEDVSAFVNLEERTDEDINNLPPPRSHRNGDRAQKGRIRSLVDLRRRRVRRRVAPPDVAADDGEPVVVEEEEKEEEQVEVQEEEKEEEEKEGELDPFAAAFPIGMTPAMVAPSGRASFTDG